jgi:hypothetical protein
MSDTIKKACTQCQAMKPATGEFFCKNKHLASGINSRCLECHAKYGRQKHRELRVEVLTFYSKGVPTCSCCGELEFEFLSIDHVRGGGNAHRKVVRSQALLRWLKKSNFPEGFQVLCHNCNLAKGFYGYCPHERRMKAVAG